MSAHIEAELFPAGPGHGAEHQQFVTWAYFKHRYEGAIDNIFVVWRFNISASNITTYFTSVL